MTVTWLLKPVSTVYIGPITGHLAEYEICFILEHGFLFYLTILVGPKPNSEIIGNFGIFQKFFGQKWRQHNFFKDTYTTLIFREVFSAAEPSHAIKIYV